MTLMVLRGRAVMMVRVSRARPRNTWGAAHSPRQRSGGLPPWTCHGDTENFADRLWRTVWLRPGESLEVGRAHGDQDTVWPPLWNPEVLRKQDPPVVPVAQVLQHFGHERP